MRAATLYWIIWFYRASSNVEPKAKTKWSREQTSQVATSINLKYTIRTKHKIFMVIACMCICISIFTEYAVHDYYRENHPADSPAEYYRRTLAIQWRGGYLLAGRALAYFCAPPPPPRRNRASYARTYE